MKYGRIVEGVVAETFTPPAGVKITDCFHPSLVFIPVDSDVEAGWIQNEDGTFSAPPPPEPAPEEPAATDPVTP